MESPLAKNLSIESGVYFKPKDFLNNERKLGVEVYMRRYKKRRIHFLNYPYKKGYYALGLRYFQRPLEDGKTAPQVHFLGLAGNIGYKLKTVKRITLDPFVGVSIFPVIWNHRADLLARDYVSFNFGLKVGFIRKSVEHKTPGTPEF